MAAERPYRLNPIAHEKVWGSRQLEPWFPNSDKKIGEVWFAEESSSLLIKFLFTTENLSVQVHPNDEQARRLEPGSRGKTEMWHILGAEEGAELALGLNRELTPEQLRQASLNGSVMDELRWVPAVPGETWFIPAGTIHAIGAGITLAEIQQNSDITYRLYDYGRGRELHLEKGVTVSDVGSRPLAAGDHVASPYFRADRITVSDSKKVPAGYLIVLLGQANLEGNQIRLGEVWRLPEPAEIQGDCSVIAVGE